MSDDEIDVVIIQISRAFAEKVHANPGGLRVWLRSADGVVPFPEVPAGVWLGTAVYNQGAGIYQMPKATRAYNKAGVR